MQSYCFLFFVSVAVPEALKYLLPKRAKIITLTPRHTFLLEFGPEESTLMSTNFLAGSRTKFD
jgi:hypothetical protein